MIAASVRPAALAAVMLSLACASSGARDRNAMPVPEGVTVDVREQTFAVFGRTPRDIWDSLNRRGPATGNRIVWGLHSWQFDWDIDWDTSAEGCRVADLRIRMSTEITMPDWRHRSGSDQELQELWDEFEFQLRDHEEAHRNYALDAIRDLNSSIRSVQAPDCETANRRIRTQTNVIMERYRALNSMYDDRSMVSWPPRR